MWKLEPLSPEEVKRLLAQPNVRSKRLGERRNRAMLEVFYRCGLTMLEFMNLAPQDINWCEKQMAVGERLISVDPRCLHWLARWAAIRPESQWFFCTLTGQRFLDSEVARLLRRLSRKALGRSIQSSQLRHTCALELLQRGVCVDKVNQYLGLTSYSLTNNLLRLLSPEQRKQAWQSPTKLGWRFAMRFLALQEKYPIPPDNLRHLRAAMVQMQVIHGLHSAYVKARRANDVIQVESRRL